MVNADDLSMYDRDGQVGKLTNCSITQCQQMIARENSWHIKEIGVVTCAKKPVKMGSFHYSLGLLHTPCRTLLRQRVAPNQWKVFGEVC